MMKDDDLQLLRGFADRQTDERTDICDCRVAFATEKRNFCQGPRQFLPTKFWENFDFFGQNLLKYQKIFNLSSGHPEHVTS